MLKSHAFIVIGCGPWIKKKWIICVALFHRREGGFERHSLQCTKYRAICWSIIEYLLFRCVGGARKKGTLTFDAYVLLLNLFKHYALEILEMHLKFMIDRKIVNPRIKQDKFKLLQFLKRFRCKNDIYCWTI